MKRFLQISLTLVIVITTILPTGVQAQKQNALTTDRALSTLLVEFACEGANCAGKTVDATAGGVILTVLTYSPAVTADLPAGFTNAQRADCINSGAKIWITSSPGVTLASGKGRPIFDGGSFTIYGLTNLTNFRAIRDAAVSSTLFCAYSRQP